MTKTIKQIADELGVSKTAVRKKIENLGLQSSLRKNGNQFVIEKEQESLIKSAFSQNETKTKNANQVCENRLLLDLVSTLQKELDAKNEQLRKKDIQLAEKDKQIENAQKIADQAQQLQAIAENKIKMLEQKETPPEPVNGSSSIESKKGFFARLFGGKL